jgi:hypothetical protein
MTILNPVCAMGMYRKIYKAKAKSQQLSDFRTMKIQLNHHEADDARACAKLYLLR